MNLYSYLLIIASLLICVKSWDNEEMEIFDLVEEINQNFYEVMGLKQDANGQEVKRAFRNLSIVLHPDKNSAEDANVVFRNLVSIYEVLKDPSKRAKYDKVLKDGLPNWKSALYYYRHVRKMSLVEIAAILFVLITISQYLVSWAVYLEKKYTAEQIFGTKLKKLQRKNKTNVDIDTILNEIPAPTIFNTLPFQIPRGIWNTPKAIKCGFQKAYEYKQEQMEIKRREAEEEENRRLFEEEILKEKEARKEKKENIRKRRQNTKAPERSEEELAGYSQLKIKELADAIKPVTSSKPQLSGGFWSDEDLAELVRLVKKYPGGTMNRWEIISDTMNRSVTEVTFMAAKLKDNGYRILGHTDSIAENIVQELSVKKPKTKTVANPILITETNWSQEQQQALETAIMKYPKSSTIDRWQKISGCIPGKTKEECMIRYKYLVELVKSQKAKKTQEDDNQTEENKIEDIKSNSNDDSCPKVVDSKADSTNENEDILEETRHSDENATKTKGKPRNKRKERKKRMEFSSDEYSE